MQFHVRHIEVDNGRREERVTFYKCDNPECDFRDYLPPRKAYPQLTFEAISPEAFKVKLCC